MYTIRKEFGFSASHVLNGLPDGHPCGRLHGHNYRVEVELGATTVSPPGFVVDYRELDSLKYYIDSALDHRHLNDVIPDVEPTAENIAAHLYFWCKAQPDWGQYVLSVSVSETVKTWATFKPDPVTPQAYVSGVDWGSIDITEFILRDPEQERQLAEDIAKALSVSPDDVAGKTLPEQLHDLATKDWPQYDVRPIDPDRPKSDDVATDWLVDDTGHVEGQL